MTTSELKQQIEKVLGNSIRCLLPSYWWKRLFHQVADRIDEVEQSVESKADKSYVDEAVGNVKVDITIDSELSDTSNNPVQNKAIYAEFAKKQDVLVSGTTIKTINGKNILGSSDLQIAEAPVVLLTDDARSVAFIQAHSDLLGGEQSYTLRGFVPFVTANTEGEPTGYEFCEVNTTKIYVVGAEVYGYLEFSYNGSIYRRTYNTNNINPYLINEEIIASSSATVPIVNSEEELINNYSSTDVAAAKILKLISLRDLTVGTIIKSLKLEPTIEYVPPGGTGYFIFSNDENTKNLLIGFNDSSVIVSFNEDLEDNYRGNLYEGGSLVSSYVKEIQQVLTENEFKYRGVSTPSASLEKAYIFFDTFIKIYDDKGLVNYVNGEIKYLAKKEEVIANEKAIKEYVDSSVANKVDKVEGKQLSTEDFTTALKTKLEGLSNYDDTEISNAVARLRDDFDSLTQEDISAAIENFNEIISFLDGIEDSESLDSIIASIEQQIANKQDKIEDLETIRSGAAFGATALQEHQDISHLATKEEVTNLQNEVIANEEVSAAAFNEINERIEQLSENVSGAVATKEELAEAIETVNATIIENEEIMATALTDLDARIKEIIARLDALENN